MKPTRRSDLPNVPWITVDGAFDPAKYTDEYRAKLLQIIRQKATGKPAARPARRPHKEAVEDLLASLQQSVQEAKQEKVAR